VWDLSPGGRKAKNIRDFEAVVTRWNRANAYAQKEQKSSSNVVINGLYVAGKTWINSGTAVAGN